MEEYSLEDRVSDLETEVRPNHFADIEQLKDTVSALCREVEELMDKVDILENKVRALEQEDM